MKAGCTIAKWGSTTRQQSIAQLASEFNLEVELKNIILIAFRFLSFYTARGRCGLCVRPGGERQVAIDPKRS
jgi:hypothetical protein